MNKIITGGPYGPQWEHTHHDKQRYVHPADADCDQGTEKAVAQSTNSDHVDHPAHYLAHPSGVECITIVQWMGFNLGNVVKYVWRADLKGDAIEDLKKARRYLDYEIERLESKP